MLDADHFRADGDQEAAGKAAGTGASPPRAPKRPWMRPRLTAFGDLRSLTMGASPGVGESGGAGIRKFP